MKLSSLSISLAFAGTLLGAGGCAAPDTDDTTDEDLRQLTTASEVAGLIEVDSRGQATDVPAQRGAAAAYRAFKFEAEAGQSIAAYVVTNNGTDPVAYILDSKFRTLKTNDNSYAAVKDAELRFSANKKGTYYLAFRNKEGTAATFMAHLATPIDTETRSFVDGWEDPSRSSLFTPYPNYDVEVNGLGHTLVRGAGCPSTPVSTRTQIQSSEKLTLRLNLQQKTVGILTKHTNGDGSVETNVVGQAPIQADGTFSLDKATEGGFGRATGRVSAGGMLIVNRGESQVCVGNFRGDPVSMAQSVTKAVGSFNRWE
jgi:hypothetical protein